MYAEPALEQARDSLHFARKKEQKVWGSEAEHEKAGEEVQRLEAEATRLETEAGRSEHG